MKYCKSVITGLLILFVNNLTAQDISDIDLKVEQLSNHVYITTTSYHESISQLAIKTDQGLILVGGVWAPEVTKALVAPIMEKTGTDRVSAIICTSRSDLTWGALALYKDVPILANSELYQAFLIVQNNIPQVLQERKNSFKVKSKQAEEMQYPGWAEWKKYLDFVLNTSPENMTVSLPNTVFDDNLTLIRDGITIDLLYFGRSDSPGGLYIFIPEENFLYVGNLLHNAHLTPTQRPNRNGYDVPRWLHTIKYILDNTTDDLHIYTDMSGVWNRSRLEQRYHYLSLLWEKCNEATAKGMSFDEFRESASLDNVFSFVKDYPIYDMSRYSNEESRKQWVGFEHVRSQEYFWLETHKSLISAVGELLKNFDAEQVPTVFKDKDFAHNPDYYITWKPINPMGQSTERDLINLGYQLLSQSKFDEAIAVFKINLQLFPDSWNGYDSLAEAYMNKGDKELAIQNYQRSVELNPKNTNGINKLEELKKEK